MRKKKTNRGSHYYEFKDSNGIPCSLQKSSSINDKIWLGASKIGLQHFKAGQGWREVDLTHSIEEHYLANNRMLLSVKEVKKLIPILQKFVDTGEI